MWPWILNQSPIHPRFCPWSLYYISKFESHWYNTFQNMVDTRGKMQYFHTVSSDVTLKFKARSASWYIRDSTHGYHISQFENHWWNTLGSIMHTRWAETQTENQSNTSRVPTWTSKWNSRSFAGQIAKLHYFIWLSN